MTTETLPLNLLKANAELQLRLTRLLQESSHQWLDSVKEASSQGIAETSAEIEGVLRSANWQALASLPPEAFWRQFSRWHQQVRVTSYDALRGAIPRFRIVAVNGKVHRQPVPVGNALGKVAHQGDFLLRGEVMRQGNDELVRQPRILPRLCCLHSIPQRLAVAGP